MKRLWISTVLALVMVTVLAFADYSYIVKGYGVNRSKLEKGDAFSLQLNLEALVQLDNSKTLTLVNTADDNFRLASGGTSVRIGQAMPKISPKIDLIYQGQANTFSFNIIEDASGNVIASDKVTISEARGSVSSGTDNGPSANTSEFQPNFDLKENPFNITFDANKYYQITAKLSNISKYGAKNVRAEIIAGADALPFNLEASTLKVNVDHVQNDRSGDFVFTLRVDKTAQSKTYNLKLKLDFDNYHGNHFTQEIPLNILVNSSERKPVVTIFSHEIIDGQLEANKSAKMQLDFMLNGTFKAKNINVTLSGFSAEGITLDAGSATQFIPFLDPNEHAKLSYDIKAMPKASGVQTLTAKINYIDDSGNAYEREEQLFLNLKSQSDQTVSGVKLAFLSRNYTVAAGNEIVVKAVVANKSTVDIENLKVELVGNSNFSILSSYVSYIDKLAPGESRNFSYTIGTAENSPEGNFPLEIAVSTGEDGSKKQIDVTAVSIVTGEGDNGKSKPKIIISQYDYGDKTVMAGQVFPLTVTFTNTSKSMGIRNVKASFTSADNVFLPVEAANSAYIEAISAGGSVTKTLNLITKNDTEPKIYSLEFEMTYEDANGKSYDSKDQPYKDLEKITINVKQPNRLEVAEMNLPEFAVVGQPIDLDVNFFNMGKSTMYNLLVTLEGDFDTREATRFVGTFQPGGNEYFSATLIPNAEGEQKGSLKFSFEDANGEPSVVEKEISFNVEAGGMGEDGNPGDFNPDPDMMGDNIDGDGTDGSGGMPSYVKYLIALAVIIAIAVVVVIVKRKKRKQQLLESLDED